MKRNILILVASASAFLLSVACNRQIDYDFSSYATLYRTSYSVDETAGEVRVPVLLNNSNGSEVQISVKLNAGKAVEGVDYELISPASGVLTFSGETDSLDVVIGITAFKGEFTGAKDFSLELGSLTENTPVGVLKHAEFTIMDLDDPRAAFLGTWGGTMSGMYQYPSYDTSFDVVADDSDNTYTKLTFSTGIDPFFYGMGLSKATYSAQMISATEVVVSAEQANGYDDVILLGFNAPDPNAATEYDHIRFSLQGDGTLKQMNAYGAYTSGRGGFYEIYLGGVFSKQ